MKVFVTGAAGFIGRAVVEQLTKNGHQALGLARSDASAQKIRAAGGEVHNGDLDDIESLKSGAKAADGVIHLAFVHDFSEEGFAKALETDRAAIAAMADAMEGTGKPLIIAGGTLLVAGIDRANEDTKPADTLAVFSQRGKSEDLVQQLSKEKNIRGMCIRLSPTVHGSGDWGFVTQLGSSAQKNGFVTNVNDGSSRWPAVHRYDAADLFVLALEKGTAGAVYHAAAEEVTTGQIMAKIGEKLKLPVKDVPQQEAFGLIGFFALPVGADNPISSDKTKNALGWTPSQPDLLRDIEENYQW